jgi:hypothetical protein
MLLCRSSGSGTWRVEVVDREPGIAPDRRALEPGISAARVAAARAPLEISGRGMTARGRDAGTGPAFLDRQLGAKRGPHTMTNDLLTRFDDQDQPDLAVELRAIGEEATSLMVLGRVPVRLLPRAALSEVYRATPALHLGQVKRGSAQVPQRHLCDAARGRRWTGARLAWGRADRLVV